MSDTAFLSTLIAALAEKAAHDYLTAQATPGNDPELASTNPAPLPALDRAA